MSTRGIPRITYGPVVDWPRPYAKGRVNAPFKSGYAATMTLLEYELERAGARDAVVQLHLRRDQFRSSDGLPRADATFANPGVIVSFDKGKAHLTFPCDRFDHWLDNLRAIALGLEALRKVDRYGITTHDEQYHGWAALPPANAKPTVEAAARIVAKLANFSGSPQVERNVIDSKDTFASLLRTARLKYHPDRNGGETLQEWHDLQKAAEVLDQHHLNGGAR